MNTIVSAKTSKKGKTNPNINTPLKDIFRS